MPFERQTYDPDQIRITANGWGRTKEGKTHWAFTFPGPIWYLNLDRDNVSLLRHPQFRDKEIYVSNLFAEPDMDPNFDMRQLLAFHTDFMESLHQAKARREGTIVIDPFHAVRGYIDGVLHAEVVEEAKATAAEKNRDFKPSRLHYSKANNRTRKYIQAVHGAPGVNLVLLHKAKQTYDNAGQPTGFYEAEQWPEVPSLVDVSVHLYRDNKGKFMSQIESCGTNPALVGAVNPNLTYETLRGLLLGLDDEDED